MRHVTCYSAILCRRTNRVSLLVGLLGTKKRIELERRKQEIEREKDELKQFYSEAFECSTHSVNHDPNFLQLLDNVVVSIILRKNEIGGF